MELDQTERAEYRRDGLVLLIEGIGRDRATDARVLQALGAALRWGFVLGDNSTASILRIDGKRKLDRARRVDRWLAVAEDAVGALHASRGVAGGVLFSHLRLPVRFTNR